MQSKLVSRALGKAVGIALPTLLVAAAGPSWALEALPVYEPVSIGALIRAAYPDAGINSAVALNEHRDAVGHAIIGNRYQAFIYTEEHGIRLLPGLEGFVNAMATDLTERDSAGRVLIAGAVQLSSSERERAVAWVYDVVQGVVLETIDIGKLPQTDWSTATAVNDKGLVVGYSRAEGGTSSSRAIVYDVRARTLHEVALPSEPVDINNADVVTGKTYRAQLIDDGGAIRASAVQDLSTSYGNGHMYLEHAKAEHRELHPVGDGR